MTNYSELTAIVKTINKKKISMVVCYLSWVEDNGTWQVDRRTVMIAMMVNGRFITQCPPAPPSNITKTF